MNHTGTKSTKIAAVQKEPQENWLDDFFGPDLASFHRDISPSITRKQVDFVLEKTCIRQGASVLDVCCGFGRHSLELARRGFEVVGIDRNETYLAEAKRLAEQENLTAEFMQIDVRELALERRFDLAINLWTSFGYYDDAANASIIEKIGQCLAIGGNFLIELDNRDWYVRHFSPRIWLPQQEGVIVLQEREFDIETSVLRMMWTFLEHGKVTKRVPYNVRYYSCHELVALLKNAGFADIEVLPDMRGGPFTFDSPVMRLLAKVG